MGLGQLAVPAQRLKSAVGTSPKKTPLLTHEGTVNRPSSSNYRVKLRPKTQRPIWLQRSRRRQNGIYCSGQGTEGGRRGGMAWREMWGDKTPSAY